VKDTVVTDAVSKPTTQLKAVQESNLPPKERAAALKQVKPNEDAKQKVAEMELGNKEAENKFTKRLDTYGKSWVTEKTAKAEEKEIKFAIKDAEKEERKEEKAAAGESSSNSNKKN